MVVGASIGMVFYPEHGKDADTLLQHADVAMYTAKDEGGGYAIYDQSYDHYSVTRLQLMAELREAFNSDELHLCFQPKIDVLDNNLVGAEALIRWDHPEHGLLGPDTFIPMAEKTGVIKMLNHWVIDKALNHCAQFLNKDMQYNISVNISARDIQDGNLPGLINELLQKWQVPPELLTLEITEGAIMTDPASAALNISEYDRMGLRLAIDDFGTGYSSLSYLKQLPVDELKIDKSFVMDMEDDENDALIVRAVIDLAHNLNLKVTAEGVESQGILDILAMLKCDNAQGYLICEPIPADAFIQWVKDKTWKSKLRQHYN